MTSSPDGNPAVVMVGSVASATQDVTLPGVHTVTRSRALHAPWWVIVLVVHVTSAGGPLEGLLQLVYGSVG